MTQQVLPLQRVPVVPKSLSLLSNISPGQLRWNKQLLEAESEQCSREVGVMLAVLSISFLPDVGTTGFQRKGGQRKEYSNYPTKDYSRDGKKQNLTPYYSLICYCVPIEHSM